MPKQIKLTDRVAEKLAQRAEEDNLSLAGEVSKLLDKGGGEDSTILSKLDYLESYLDKRLSKLESLLDDTMVDRLAGTSRANRSYPQDNDILDWDVFRYIVFDLCKDDDSPEWVSQSVHDAMDNLSDSIDTIVLDGYIWAVNDYGKSKILKVSPRVEEAIREGRRYE